LTYDGYEGKSIPLPVAAQTKEKGEM